MAMAQISGDKEQGTKNSDPIEIVASWVVCGMTSWKLSEEKRERWIYMHYYFHLYEWLQENLPLLETPML